MSDYVQYLINEQNNANGILLEVLTSGYEDFDYIVALEGKDDKAFYYDYLVNYLDTQKIFILDCGGKPPLLGFKKTSDAYNWASRPSILFLCDRDFDEYLGLMEAGVFYTEGYSIESYLATEDYVKYVISKHSTVQLTQNELTEFMGKYTNTFYQLAYNVIFYNAYMCSIRETGEHPMFDDFGIDHLFCLNNGECTPRANRQTRSSQIWNLTTRPSVSCIRKWGRMFFKHSPFKWLRGKLAVQLAKKSYEIAKRNSPASLRKKLPEDIKMNREGLGGVKNYLSDLLELRDYCREIAT